MKKRWIALCATAALAGTLLPTVEASANHAANLEIRVGAYLGDPEAGGVPGESMRFFTDEVTVHRGDSLKFVGDFHTATLLPTSVTDVDAWIADNAENIGDPWHFINNNPDNDEYPWKVNGFFGNPECGAPDDQCSYTGGDVLESGVLFNYADFSDPEAPPVVTGFNVTVDANPGDVFWVICRIHPTMRMRVTVVNNNEDSTTQDEIDAETNATISEDRTAATALHESLLMRHQFTTNAKGKRVWKAWAGYDTEDFSLFAMYPRRLKIRKGERVRWEFSQLNHETHTVTHPPRKAMEILNSEPILCDPNGDSTSGGETQADFSSPSPCPEGSEPEVAISPTFALPGGDGVVTGRRDFESSGLRGQLADSPASGFAPYSLRFTKPNDKPYKYVCLLHPFMRGEVKVR